MLTLNQVNQAIAAKGIKAELVKGKGYFYFVGDAVDHCSGTSVMHNSLNELSLDEWLEELDCLIEWGE